MRDWEIIINTVPDSGHSRRFTIHGISAITGRKAKDLSAVKHNRIVVACDLLKKLDEFRNFQANWGTYNEKAVKSVSCDQAEAFVSYFAFRQPHVHCHVYPTAGGDIGLDWELNGNDYSVLFSDAGIELLTGDESDEPELCADVFELLGKLETKGFHGL